MKRGRQDSTIQLAVLALLPEHSDSTTLEAAVHACGGRWIRPARPDLTSLHFNRPVSVILYDRELPGRWQQAVALLAELSWQPSVILLSLVNDQYLWEEVVRQGGYDVLPKTAKAEDITRLLRAAYAHWRSARQPSAELAVHGSR
jgi:hypothetical protein